MLKRQTRLALAFALLAAGSGVGLADDARNKPEEPPLDDELLEFLGSVDTASDTGQPDDGTWIEYLSQTDIGKVGAKAKNPPASSAANPTATPATSPTMIAAKAAASPPAEKPDTSGAKQHE